MKQCEKVQKKIQSISRDECSGYFFSSVYGCAEHKPERDTDLRGRVDLGPKSRVRIGQISVDGPDYRQTHIDHAGDSSVSLRFSPLRLGVRATCAASLGVPDTG